MITCENCHKANPSTARFCMSCGRALPDREVEPDAVETRGDSDAGAGISTFSFSIIASVLLSLLLIMVFRMPILILAGVLPLFWLRKKK